MKKRTMCLQDENRPGQAQMNFDLQQQLPAAIDFTETEK